MTTVADVAALALAEVLAARPRTPQRRAAAHLYVAATVPPATSLAAVKRAVLSYGAEHVQQGALALLGRLTQTGTAAP